MNLHPHLSPRAAVSHEEAHAYVPWTAPGQAAGEALAAEIQFAVECLGLEPVVSVEYLPELGAMRLEWAYDEAVDFPATPEWADRVREGIRRYARARATRCA